MRSCLPLVLFSIVASSAHAAPPGPRDAPASIQRVVVFSNSARVYRVARAKIAAGKQRLRLASLPTTIRQDSVQVDCKTAKVEHVQVVVGRGRLPRQAEAEKLTQQIEALDDKVRMVRIERSQLQTERQFVRNLSLRPPSSNEKLDRPEDLPIDGWRRILRWVETRSLTIDKRLTAIKLELRKLSQKRLELAVKAKALDLHSVDRPSLQVLATLKGGPGPHRVTLSYMVNRVSWRPSYDLRYEHNKRRVAATFYADLRQRSGEDWKGVKLEFSTAQPLTLLAIPELPTWIVGRKRDFIPRPTPRYEPPPHYWYPPRVRISVSPAVRRLKRLLAAGPRDTTTLDGVGGVEQNDYYDKGGAATRYRPKKTRHRWGRRHKDRAKRERRRYAPPAPPRAIAAKPSIARQPAEDLDDLVALRSMSKSMSGRSGGRRSYRRRMQTVRLPWTDVGYRPPYLSPSAPAKAAQGYLFKLRAPGKHDLTADGKQRRIPLMRRSLAVKPVHRIVVGRSKHAYLMAQVKNTTGRPILRGHANLFSGAMFSGRSMISTALPGHMMRLPLGVDDGVKVVRHLTQKTVTKGVLFKDDITEYTVKIEIANHHRYPVEVDLRDQVPMPTGKKIEITSFVYRADGRVRATNAPASDDKRGRGWTRADNRGQVVWMGLVRGKKVKKLSFTFRIVRPKDWMLRQHGG